MKLGGGSNPRLRRAPRGALWVSGRVSVLTEDVRPGLKSAAATQVEVLPQSCQIRVAPYAADSLPIFYAQRFFRCNTEETITPLSDRYHRSNWEDFGNENG
jgi:hypothetical protein